MQVALVDVQDGRRQGAPAVTGGDEERVGGVAAHALDPQAADRLWEYATDAVR